MRISRIVKYPSRAARGIFYLTLIASCLAMPASADVFGGRASGGSIPAPRLVYPSTDTIDLTGKETLRFEWSPFEGSRTSRKYYDLRIYRTYEMLESTLLYKERVDPGYFAVELDASMFETGQVYTWGVRQVYEVEGKSRRNIHSFMVIRNNDVKI